MCLFRATGPRAGRYAPAGFAHQHVAVPTEIPTKPARHRTLLSMASSARDCQEDAFATRARRSAAWISSASRYQLMPITPKITMIIAAIRQ